MAQAADPTRYVFEYPDEAGYPDGKGTLSQDQVVLIDEVIDDPHAPAFEFYVVKDEKDGIYDAIVGDTEIGGLTYNVASDGRLVLLAVSVFREFREQGIATELIRCATPRRFCVVLTSSVSPSEGEGTMTPPQSSPSVGGGAGR